jgi:hypothetical protein
VEETEEKILKEETGINRKKTRPVLGRVFYLYQEILVNLNEFFDSLNLVITTNLYIINASWQFIYTDFHKVTSMQ